jgi:hypothetical protein
MNQQLLDRYVAGRLGEKESEEFEEYCLTHPDFARQVEAEQLLRAGVQRVVRESPGEFAAPARRPVHWPVALAASLVLGLGAMWLLRTPDPAPLMTLAAVEDAGALPVLRLAMVRSAVDGMPRLPPGRVRVEIAGLFDAGTDYTVSLQRQDPPQAVDEGAQLRGERSASGTSLHVVIDGDRLAAGTYTLQILRAQSSDEPLEFVFVKN